MEVEGAGGVRGANTAPVASYPTVLPTFVPNHVFMDKDGDLRDDVDEINTHTAVLGRSGKGKTHLTAHLIMKWNKIKQWGAHGWVVAIMPSGTWKAQGKNGVRRYWQLLLEEKQVYFIDKYPSKKEKEALLTRIERTATDNMERGVPSLLIIDDCVKHMLLGNLDITNLLTNGRSMELTVISLWQSPVRSGTYGNIVRENVGTVVFFDTGVKNVVKVEDWVSEEQVKEFKAIAGKEVIGRMAGVITTEDKMLYKIQAPETYPIATLGRPDLRGKLLNLEDTDDGLRDEQDARTRLVAHGVRQKKKPGTYSNADADGDDGDEYLPVGEASDDDSECESDGVEAEDRPRCPNPPGCPAPWEFDNDDRVYRCKKCGYEPVVVPKMGGTDDDDAPGDDDEGRDGGGRGRKRERSPSDDRDGGQGGQQRSKATTANDDRKRIFVNSNHRRRLLTTVRNTVEQECRSVLAVADRVCDWVTRLAIAEIKVITYDPIAELQHQTADLKVAVTDQLGIIAEQENKIEEQNGKIAVLEDKVSMLTAEQRLAPGKPGRPKKEVAGYVNYLVAEVMERMQAGSSGAAAKPATEAEQFAEHIAGLAVQRMQQSSQ